MNCFPSSSFSTTTVSILFAFGKRRDSSVGLGEEITFGTGAGVGVLGFESQDESRIAKAATGSVRIPLEYRHASVWRTILPAAIIFTMCAHAADQVKLIVLDPGHFHAAPGAEGTPEYRLDPIQVSVYAPMSPDVVDYLNRASSPCLVPARGKSHSVEKSSCTPVPDYLRTDAEGTSR